jgi:hypothetical protein
MGFTVSLASGVLFILLATVFVVVFVCTLVALRASKAFRSQRLVLSVCVAALSVMGMANLFGLWGAELSSEHDGTRTPLVTVVLIPYQALAIALLLLLPLLWASKRARRRRARPDRTEAGRPRRKKKPDGSNQRLRSSSKNGRLKANRDTWLRR